MKSRVSPSFLPIYSSWTAANILSQTRVVSLGRIMWQTYNAWDASSLTSVNDGDTVLRVRRRAIAQHAERLWSGLQEWAHGTCEHECGLKCNAKEIRAKKNNSNLIKALTVTSILRSGYSYQVGTTLQHWSTSTFITHLSRKNSNQQVRSLLQLIQYFI